MPNGSSASIDSHTMDSVWSFTDWPLAVTLTSLIQEQSPPKQTDIPNTEATDVFDAVEWQPSLYHPTFVELNQDPRGPQETI